MSKFFQASIKKEKTFSTNENDININKKKTKKFILSPSQTEIITNKKKSVNITPENISSGVIKNENTNTAKSINTSDDKKCQKNNVYKMINENYTSGDMVYANDRYVTLETKSENEIYSKDILQFKEKNYNEKYNIIDDIKSDYTSINKLQFSSLKKEPSFTYIQKDKVKLYNYNIMLDTYTNKFLTDFTNESKCENSIPCHYCRRNFNNAPLGIPIRYYPSLYVLKNNQLQNSKYSFNYKENTVKLNSNERERLLNILKQNEKITIEGHNEVSEENTNTTSFSNSTHKIITKQFFETEGIFCSFNCIVSQLEENHTNPIYTNSNHLLYYMYKQIFGEFPNQSFIRSPSWKLRNVYGGPLTDDDYDKFLQSVPILDSKQIKLICSYPKIEQVYEVLI